MHIAAAMNDTDVILALFAKIEDGIKVVPQQSAGQLAEGKSDPAHSFTPSPLELSGSSGWYRKLIDCAIGDSKALPELVGRVLQAGGIQPLPFDALQHCPSNLGMSLVSHAVTEGRVKLVLPFPLPWSTPEQLKFINELLDKEGPEPGVD